jgi:hypothetical protein
VIEAFLRREDEFIRIAEMMDVADARLECGLPLPHEKRVGFGFSLKHRLPILHS